MCPEVWMFFLTYSCTWKNNPYQQTFQRELGAVGSTNGRMRTLQRGHRAEPPRKY